MYQHPLIHAVRFLKELCLTWRMSLKQEVVFCSHLNLPEGQLYTEILILVACSVLSSSIYANHIMYHFLYCLCLSLICFAESSWSWMSNSLIGWFVYKEFFLICNKGTGPTSRYWANLYLFHFNHVN